MRVVWESKKGGRERGKQILSGREEGREGERERVRNAGRQGKREKGVTGFALTNSGSSSLDEVAFMVLENERRRPGYTILRVRSTVNRKQPS